MGHSFNQDISGVQWPSSLREITSATFSGPDLQGHLADQLETPGVRPPVPLAAGRGGLAERSGGAEARGLL